MQPPVDYSELPQGDVLCIDMKSFYASVEAVERGLDPFRVALAVVGNQDQKGSVILAATPPMKKKYNIRTGSRLYEVPRKPEVILVEPRMSLYMRRSLQVIELFTGYVPREDIFIYSIDESWLDLDGTKKRHGGAEKMVQQIRKDIYRRFRLAQARDEIRDRFGPDKLDFGLSRARGSIRERLNGNIGGHKK